MAEYIAALYDGLAVYRLPPPHNARRTMLDTQLTSTNLRTPKSAAIAGIIFSVLLITIFWLLRTSFPPQAAAAGPMLTERPQTIMTALSLVPFAGIAFLWFIGVLRDRLGEREDRFFATVYLGSGLLFLAMLFTAAAVVSSIVFASAARPNHSMDPDDISVRQKSGIRSDEYLRHQGGGRVHVLDLHGRRSHPVCAALCCLCRISAGGPYAVWEPVSGVGFLCVPDLGIAARRPTPCRQLPPPSSQPSIR